MKVVKKRKNNKKLIVLPTTQKESYFEFLAVFCLLCLFGYLIFSLVSQIYSLNLELKNLINLVQLLQDSQLDLKNQLTIKDQQIKLLEDTIKDLDVSSVSSLKDSHNFELLKKEVIKNNKEIAHFYIKISGAIFGAVLVFKLVKFFL